MFSIAVYDCFCCDDEPTQVRSTGPVDRMIAQIKYTKNTGLANA